MKRKKSKTVTLFKTTISDTYSGIVCWTVALHHLSLFVDKKLSRNLNKCGITGAGLIRRKKKKKKALDKQLTFVKFHLMLL